jgi:flagellar biosynthetic protein FliS
MDAKTLQQAQRSYAEGQVLSAHPVEIVHMLYHVAIDNLHAAIAHLKNRDAFARAYAVSKAEEAVGELVLSLDHSVNAPFTHTMADLYAYALQRTVEGHSKQSEQAFQEALSILTTLSDTWAEVKRRVCEENHEPEASPEPRVPEPVAVELEEKSKDPYAAYSQSLPVAAGSRDWSC